MSSDDPWWACGHSGIGRPGCPTCDGRLEGEVREYLRAARGEIGRLAGQVAVANIAGRRARQLVLRLADAAGVSTDPVVREFVRLSLEDYAEVMAAAEGEKLGCLSRQAQQVRPARQNVSSSGS